MLTGVLVILLAVLSCEGFSYIFTGCSDLHNTITQCIAWTASGNDGCVQLSFTWPYTIKIHLKTVPKVVPQKQQQLRKCCWCKWCFKSVVYVSFDHRENATQTRVHRWLPQSNGYSSVPHTRPPKRWGRFLYEFQKLLSVCVAELY